MLLKYTKSTSVYMVVRWLRGQSIECTAESNIPYCQNNRMKPLILCVVKISIWQTTVCKPSLLISIWHWRQRSNISQSELFGHFHQEYYHSELFGNCNVFVVFNCLELKVDAWLNAIFKIRKNIYNQIKCFEMHLHTCIIMCPRTWTELMFAYC